MSTRALSVALFSAVSALALGGCAADSTEADGDDGIVAADSDLTSTITLGPNAERVITLNATATRDVTITLDCAPPAHPDDRGPVVAVKAPSLGVSGAGPAPAGFWSRAVPQGATCRERSEWRSANTDHTHYRVGEQGAAAGMGSVPRFRAHGRSGTASTRSR